MARALRSLLLAGAVAASAACAAHHPPAAGQAERLRTVRTFSGQVKVGVSGPELRGRARVLVGFARPDRLRVEWPGPTGARVVAVAADGTLTAVFPGERAVFTGPADAASLEAVLGVGLEPAEIMDLLVGTASPRLRRFEADWGPSGPRRVDAVLPDGTHLRVAIEEAETGRELPAAAFVPPAHEGFRSLDAAGARSLWGGS